MANSYFFFLSLTLTLTLFALTLSLTFPPPSFKIENFILINKYKLFQSLIQHTNYKIFFSYLTPTPHQFYQNNKTIDCLFR